MYLVIEENPNCEPDERVFSTSGSARPVDQIQLERPGSPTGWWDVMGVDAEGKFIPALAEITEDSGAGTAWLIRGGEWGVRFRPAGDESPWSLADTRQWGAPFFVLDITGTSIRFD